MICSRSKGRCTQTVASCPSESRVLALLSPRDFGMLSRAIKGTVSASPKNLENLSLKCLGPSRISQMFSASPTFHSSSFVLIQYSQIHQPRQPRLTITPIFLALAVSKQQKPHPSLLLMDKGRPSDTHPPLI